jgi:hypothetical protein
MSPFCNTLIVYDGHSTGVHATENKNRTAVRGPSPNAPDTVAVESELVFTALRTMGAKYTEHTSARNLVTRHSSAEKTELLYHYRDLSTRVMRLICVLCVRLHLLLFYTHM